MVKRYLGAALVAFVLGCVGPLTVGAAHAASEPDDGTSLLGPVTTTLGGLASDDTEPEPVRPAPDTGEPDDEPAPGADSSGALGAVTTTVGTLADAPRNLLSGVADGEQIPRPELPEEPDTPVPPDDTPPPESPDEPDKPKEPNKPEVAPPADTPADSAPSGSPANPVAADPPGVDEANDVTQVSFTEPEHSEQAPPRKSITQPTPAEPDRTKSSRPKQDIPAYIEDTRSGGDTPAEQGKSATRQPENVRAEAISLNHVTRTPFVVAIALLTAVGVVTVRRVIAVR